MLPESRRSGLEFFKAIQGHSNIQASNTSADDAEMVVPGLSGIGWRRRRGKVKRAGWDTITDSKKRKALGVRLSFRNHRWDKSSFYIALYTPRAGHFC